ncbi:MAG: caspase family protein [Saprospiraceae bacterium]|nr:caspase family protein [Saprospiraceae bacterium]
MPKKTTRAGRKTNEQAPQNALPKGKNYLFIIGIDEYKHQPRLYNAVKDAKDILELLTKKYQFSKDSKFLFTLFNQEATQENIFTTLDKLSELMTEEDKLLIYYSGHGELKKNIGEGFWIPYDGNPKNPAGTYISFSILTKYIKAIKAFHTFIIADSCFSGALFTERGAVSDFRDRLESIPSRWLLTAGRDEVVADGQPGDNSPFADAVLWWLKNNKDPRLRVSDFVIW